MGTLTSIDRARDGNHEQDASTAGKRNADECAMRLTAIDCMSPSDGLSDMLEMMAELEAMCARLATDRISVENIKQLKASTLRCAEAADANDPETYNWENETFHMTLYEASGNSYLAEEARKLHQRLQPFRRGKSYDQALMFKSLEEHKEIIAAIESGNAKAAAILARRHVPTP